VIFENMKIKIYITVILPVVLYGYGTWFVNCKGGAEAVGI